MPSTRKQKAKEKRSRQSDVMSDIENLDVMLGNYANSDIRDRDIVDQIEIDPESSRRQPGFGQEESNYRSHLNTNLSENSEITVETSRAISSEISSQMSRKLEEMKSDLNSHILEVINSAVTTRSRSGLHLLWRNAAIHARKRTRQSYTTLSKLYLMPYFLSKQQHELSLTEAQRKLFKNDLDKKKISGLMISHAIVSSLPVSTDENSMPI